MDEHPTDLTGQLLIAMPGMGDPRFEHSVVYLCAHSEEGAMGLIVNKPADGVMFPDMLAQLSIEAEDIPKMPVHFGGPVEFGRGFVLHSPDYQSEGSTLSVAEGFAMTGTLDILEDIARGQGPGEALLALGYAGWGPGQLESEIAANGWLMGQAQAGLVYGPEDGGKWTEALRQMGIDPMMLSADAGRA
jgi:putative transcriptional regulator